MDTIDDCVDCTDNCFDCNLDGGFTRVLTRVITRVFDPNMYAFSGLIMEVKYEKHSRY